MRVLSDEQHSFVPYPRLNHIRYFIMDIKIRSAHMHDAFELITVLKNSIEATVQDTVYQLTEGDIFIINPNTPHSFFCKDGRALIMDLQLSPTFAREYLPKLENLHFTSCGPIHSCKETEQMKKLFFSSIYTYYKKEDGNNCRCFATTVLCFKEALKLFPNIELSDPEYKAQVEESMRMQRIARFIQNNLAEPRLLQKTAEAENLSTTYLSRLFSENFSITFQQFLKQQRLEKAIKLLNSTNLPVYDICFECGFQDYRQLNKYCKETFGKTASECRGVITVADHGPINYNRKNSNEYMYNEQDTLIHLSSMGDFSWLSFDLSQ